jgi:regulatory protein
MTARDATAALDQLRAAVARVESGGTAGGTADGPQAAVSAAKNRGSAFEAAGDPAAVARGIVLRQLTNAPKTRQQLREALVKRDCPEEVAEGVLDRMTEVGLVDDVAYAELLVRSKQAGRGLARRALSHALRAKGVDDQTAADVLASIDPADERARARHLVDKKLATMHGLEIAVQTRRLAGMLARKGYAGDVAWGAIRDGLADAPEHRRD